MSPLSAMESKSALPFWRLFLLRYLPVVGVVLATLVVAEKIRNNTFLEELARDAEAALDMQSQRLEASIKWAVSDLSFLAEMADRMAPSGMVSSEFVRVMEERLLVFTLGHPRYRSISLLDGLGGELVKIERVGEEVGIVPESALLQHSKHRHLEEALLFPHEFIVSPSDDRVLTGGTDATGLFDLLLTGTVGERDDLVALLFTALLTSAWSRATLTRQQALEKLTDKEALLNAATTAVRDGMILVDSRGRVQLWNSGAEEIFQYTAEEVKGRDIHSLVTPESHLAVAREGMRGFGEDGRGGALGQVLELPACRKDGSEFTIELSLSPFEVGGENFAVGVARDISDRKVGEEKLALSDQILSSIGDLVLVGDKDGSIIFASPSVETMLGYVPDEMLGDGWWRLTRPDPLERAAERQETSQTARGEQEPDPGAYDRMIPTKDGGDRWVRWREFKGPGETVVGVGSDVSARKELEKSLMDAVRRAEAANMAKEEFMANMSHEIRTPMNAIIGMADLLWETPLTQEQRDYVQVFKAAGDALLTLINDLLDLAKVQEGELRLEEVGFNLHTLVEDTLEVFAAAAQAKGLEIGARISDGVPAWVVGDPTRIRQVLSNLLGNAVKFTEEGQVIAQVEIEGSDPFFDSPGVGAPGAVLHFTVSDTGIGIPSEKVDRVFERFIQADSSTTRKHGGSGLGLAICERLVSLMNGKIWAESGDGQGSTFHVRITLPVTKAPPSEVEGVTDLKGVRVLVVDDNATNRLILREILTSWGAVAVEFPDGQGALEAISAAAEAGTPFRLALLDGEMPGMDGYELARRISGLPEPQRPSNIMLTSRGDGRSRDELESLGLAGHLLKPVRRPSLLHTITGVLAGTVVEGGPVPHSPATVERAEAVSLEDEGETRHLDILVVDDSPDNRMLMEAYLKKTPHRVAFAEDGAEAVEAVRRDPGFDLVFMDIQMPVMDGHEATRTIRSWEEEIGRAPLRIVALSAHAMKEEIQMSLDSGCDAHLTKPIKKKLLLDAIAEVAAAVEG